MNPEAAKPKGHAIALLAIICLTLVGAGIIYFYFIYPVLAAGPAQPIPFSHRIHVNVKEIDCFFCHNTVGRTRFAGMPSTEKCLFCHKYIIPKHPYIVELRQYVDNEEPVAWTKVTWLPDHVYFSHQRHIRKEIECTECHGAIETMDRVRREVEFSMGFCLTCHQERDASVDCWTCHQ